MPHERMQTHTSSAFVVSCIDPRFADAIWEFMKKQHPYHFDAPVNTPGGAKALAEDTVKRQEIYNDLTVAIALHSVEYLYVFVHSQCGGYNIPDRSQEQQQQIADLYQVRNSIKTHPQDQVRNLTVRAFIADGHDDSIQQTNASKTRQWDNILIKQVY
ncbi:MAG: hypothetical protein F4X82_03580 [Candidatus Spechtbacteria bacterium SB0662_bin_43]|uniref:Carbonic anhydrase n=1 Tax=Candidatus Spechtbacteria bacterium SB0662_bin_43 TaxID=2604897 RepID=A0A845DAU7_9BACT|nr:hypothetical protein [Candidatus Spechtbacteria bacterium SB0662_bin_43]